MAEGAAGKIIGTDATAALFTDSVEVPDRFICLLLLDKRLKADLGVTEETLLGAFAGKGQSIAMHPYPPCRHHRDKVVGISPHTDTLGLTLLLHVDDTPGLQIRRRGRWFAVRPLPGALVVNVGDVLTNGAYVSVEHRVVPDAERHRVTVAVFPELLRKRDVLN